MILHQNTSEVYLSLKSEINRLFFLLGYKSDFTSDLMP
jgi:hypothetical protein